MNTLNEIPQAQTPSQATPQKQELVFGLDGGPKTMFILGLAVGIGSMALLALIAIISMLLNGSDFNLAKGTSAAANNPAAVVDNTNNQPAAEQPAAGPVPEVTDADHIRGKADAKVTIIEYSDFQCPYCQRHTDTIKQTLTAFPNDVRVVFRHFPLTSIHPFAQKAAEASECANKQGKFWDMHDQLFVLSASDAGLSIDGMKKIASDLKLDTNAFNTCLDSGETAAIIDASAVGGSSAGVTGTPANFVNGELMEGALPFDTFKQAIQQAGGKS